MIVANWQLPLSTNLFLTEKNFVTDAILRNLTFSTTSVTFEHGITRIEAKFRPLQGNEVQSTLTANQPSVIVPLFSLYLLF